MRLWPVIVEVDRWAPIRGDRIVAVQRFGNGDIYTTAQEFHAGRADIVEHIAGFEAARKMAVRKARRAAITWICEVAESGGNTPTPVEVD